MTNEELIETYIDSPEIYQTQSGESVLGQEVSSDNRMVYIIRLEDGDIDIRFAEEVDVVIKLPEKSVSSNEKSIDLSSLLK